MTDADRLAAAIERLHEYRARTPSEWGRELALAKIESALARLRTLVDDDRREALVRRR
jgi:hypothetical protein